MSVIGGIEITSDVPQDLESAWAEMCRLARCFDGAPSVEEYRAIAARAEELLGRLPPNEDDETNLVRLFVPLALIDIREEAAARAATRTDKGQAKRVERIKGLSAFVRSHGIPVGFGGLQ